MTENVSLNYNSSSTENNIQVSLSENWVNASAQIAIADVDWLQDAIDATIAAARTKISSL